jgi:hypothetical protein
MVMVMVVVMIMVMVVVVVMVIMALVIVIFTIRGMARVRARGDWELCAWRDANAGSIDPREVSTCTHIYRCTYIQMYVYTDARIYICT